MSWPLLAGALRMVIVVGGGWLLLLAGADLAWVFAALGVGLLIFGLTIAGAVASGVWFRGGDRVRDKK